MQRRVFSREFKLEAVKLVTERGAAVSQTARDLDVGGSVLRRWMREVTADSCPHDVVRPCAYGSAPGDIVGRGALERGGFWTPIEDPVWAPIERQESPDRP